MDQKERLAAMIKDLINDRNEQAQVTLHDYLVQKMRTISGFDTLSPAEAPEAATGEPAGDPAGSHLRSSAHR